MIAVRMHNFGDSSVLKLEEVPLPEISDTDVLVKIVASSINPIEWKIRSGMMKQALGRELPVTLGSDFSGVVDKVGAKVTGFAPGDAVYGSQAMSQDGSYAEYVAVPHDRLAKKPSTLSFEVAATVPMVSETANTVFAASAGKPGQSVLIHGAGGAVGHWLIQIAKQAGLTVIATASGNDLEAVRALGADSVIDYRSERFEDAGKVDLVFDLVGGETQARSWSVLNPGGKLITTTMPPDQAKASEHGVTATMVFTNPSGQGLTKTATSIDSGKLSAQAIGAVFSLAQVSEAHALGEAGKAPGKMVIQVQAS